MAADFHWKVRRHRFRALDELRFPPHAGNALRGALGYLLETHVFRPPAQPGLPSGLQTPPPPFLVRAAHLDGCTVPAGQEWELRLHLFSGERDIDPALQTLCGARVESVASETEDGVVDLLSPEMGVSRVRVVFETATELKGHEDSSLPPPFHILLKRARDRVSILRTLYGGGPIAADFRGLGQRAEAVSLAAGAVTEVALARRSTRTGDIHSLGGFRGEAVYEGDLAEFVPWLRAAEAAGVGRHTVWGNGALRLTVL
jgi:hypothetical protein